MDKDIKTIKPNDIKFDDIQKSLKYASHDMKHMNNSIRFAEENIAEETDRNPKSSYEKDNNSDSKVVGSKPTAFFDKDDRSKKSSYLGNYESNNSLTHKVRGVLKIFTAINIAPIAMVVMGTILFMMVLMLDIGHEQRAYAMAAGKGFPDDVEAWRGVVNERLLLYSEDYPDLDLQQYSNVILTIIWQESDGNPDGSGVNGDIMQSRESGYWSYQIPSDWDSLSTPERSIDAGVRYFIECLNAWPVDGPDDTDNLQIVLQGYNYGVAFLYYARSVGADRWTEELSQAYSDRMGGNYGTVTYAERWLTKYQTAVGGGSWLWPMPASHDISSGFGARWGSTHRGIDIPCDIGSEVIASNSGTVYYVGEYGTGGNAVIIDCGDGIMNYYYHLSGYAVSQGETVRSGQIIAYSGNTGNSTGPHLHFGVTINGEYVDPEDYLN